MKGLITEMHFKKDVLDNFIEKFVESEYAFRNPATGVRQLIWCYFRDEGKVFSTEELFQSQLKINTPVYLYNERTEEMFLTDFEDVRNFINNFEPWDKVDAEIFDDSLEWVIAVTHEDVSKVLGLSVTIDEYDYEKDMMQGD